MERFVPYYGRKMVSGGFTFRQRLDEAAETNGRETLWRPRRRLANGIVDGAHVIEHDYGKFGRDRCCAEVAMIRDSKRFGY